MTPSKSTPLAHPLPAGMRDLLPGEAAQRRSIADRALAHVALHGYELVTPPAFELAEVLERGLGPLAGNDVVRFVEPESGSVAALRPDMTPQIARLVATRLAGGPLPVRLAYEGAVVRRRQGRARKHRQIAQAGVELCGPCPGGDLEVLSLAASLTTHLHLRGVILDVGHAGIARALLASLSSDLAAEVSAELARKDASRVARLLEGTAHARELAALCDLYGGGPGDVAGEDLLERARSLLQGTPAEASLSEIASLWRVATRQELLAPLLRVDLGAARGFAYYTGLTFQILAPGPGEPLGAGGRYDDLLARFDAPMPAIGFALNLDSVAWAREALGVADDRPIRVVVKGNSKCSSAHAIASRLRSHGVPVVVHAASSSERALAFAQGSRFTHLVEEADVGLLVFHLTDGAPAPTLASDLDEVVRALTDSRT